MTLYLYDIVPQTAKLQPANHLLKTAIVGCFIL